MVVKLIEYGIPLIDSAGEIEVTVGVAGGAAKVNVGEIDKNATKINIIEMIFFICQ